MLPSFSWKWEPGTTEQEPRTRLEFLEGSIAYMQLSQVERKEGSSFLCAVRIESCRLILLKRWVTGGNALLVCKGMAAFLKKGPFLKYFFF